jgi:hypothetical protein
MSHVPTQQATPGRLQLPRRGSALNERVRVIETRTVHRSHTCPMKSLTYTDRQRLNVKWHTLTAERAVYVRRRATLSRATTRDA